MNGDPMGTLSEAIAELQADGYTGNWYATSDHLLRCSESGEDADPADVSIDRTLRFEGQSDPDDEVILYALSEPGGRRGVYSAQYGASMPSEDAAVIARMRHRTGDGPTDGSTDNSLPRPNERSTVTLNANKALVRRLFEEVFPAGDPSALGDLVAPGIIDHDPMPGQPAGVQGIEYVMSTLLTAQPDLRFTVDDLVAEADRVAIRWTLRGTNTGPTLGQPPSGRPVDQTAIVIFRIADGKIAERWAGYSPGE